MGERPRDDDEGAANVGTIAGRYRAHELLGQGGMGRVHRVTDAVSGRELALKQLVLNGHLQRRSQVNALFEREFHTLAQLRHPRVIEVYDYGVNPGVGPYYTMELLDGGDLRERSPMPWRAACAVFFDVCSSLALLHSRRLLHRDVSPRNIRCTRSGAAKLIDFGAMAPMGRGGGSVVGTPAFTPPEILQRSALDARTDLFSVGAALYYALTRSLAYPARSFADLLEAWATAPVPPGRRVADIPAELDDLVMSLLSLEPALRPHSSFEVMQRLAAIADFECAEPIGVSRGYLSTPVLVGREAALAEVRELLARAVAGQGGGLLIHAPGGLGRSRMLDACALEAKTLGATLLRAATLGPDDDFAVAQALLQHVQQALSGERSDDHFPELFVPVEHADAGQGGDDRFWSEVKPRTLSEPDANADAIQDALGRFMVTLSQSRPLVIVVDDAHRIDAPSAAFLATLVELAGAGNILVAMTAEIGPHEPISPVQRVIARRCRQLTLPLLDRAQTETLLGSVFGEVANLHRVAAEIAAIAHGNPREILVIAQHLVDHGSIRYAGGSWTLPSSLSADDLPSSAEAAIDARVAALDPLARRLVELQALAFHEAFAREDYQALCPDADSSAVDAAISELLMQQALASDGRTYTLANRLWRAALGAPLGAAELRAHHTALCGLYEDVSSAATVYHLFHAGLDQRGLEAMLQRVEGLAQTFDFRLALRMNVAELGPTYLRAIEVAGELGRPPRQQSELRRWLASMSVILDARYYWSVAPAWRAQLEHDAGLDLWQQDTAPGTPLERLTRALTRAGERHLATPEAQRVYRVDEAIRALAQYVAVSVAVGTRTMDAALIATLPELIEPYAPLSPVLDAIWQNVSAAREVTCHGRYERAHARWVEVHARLEQITGAELQHVEVIRNAVAFAVGVCEAVIGRASADEWADRLDHDPMQRVNALYLRKIVRFEQGDWSGADRLRKQAEVLALQAGLPQMFTALLVVELTAHAQARDLGGLKEVMGRIEPLAERYPGWVPYRHLGEARFQLIRGDLDAAEREFERCMALAARAGGTGVRLMPVWLAAITGTVETLLARGRHGEAHDRARAWLSECDERSIELQSYELSGLYAVAAAKLGAASAAVARLEAVIERQHGLGVTGLKLGLSYELRARAALATGDAAVFQQYARLTAREYRHGARSPLGARYERLMNEARRSGYEAPTEPVDLDASTRLETSQLGTLPGAQETENYPSSERKTEPPKRR